MEYAVIGTVIDSEHRNVRNFKWGQVFFYTEIERGGDWFDLLRREVATDEAKDEIVIPENLRPNAKVSRFVFDLDKHHLYYEHKNDKGEYFAHNKMRRVFESIFSQVSSAQPAGVDVKATVVPTSDAIERVLAIPQINRLVIRLERPNADDIGASTRRLMDELERQGAAREDLILTKSKRAPTLTPSDDTLEMAEVAANNGYVRTSGTLEDGTRVDRQTTSYPQEDRLPLTDSEDPFDALFAYIQAHRE
jgi:hypothetical protein